MTNTTAPAARLLLTLGVTAFAQAYSTAAADSTGTKAVADIARAAGATYLAAAEQARKLCYKGRASLTGPMNATRVRLH